MQRYTVYFIWKLLYIFRMVPSPIIRRANNCIYSIWYLSDRYCYLPLAADSNNGVTNTRCCRYSCLRSWWWVTVPYETCRVVSRAKWLLCSHVSRSPLIHVVGRSFCLYTDSLFAQIGDCNDKCSSSLEVECWNEDETHAAQQSPTQF